MQYISKSNLCVVVLDNVDLYEDEALETNVFTEGLALSKRICCNVIVSMRDTTFVRHQADSTFNAFELRKLWLDPPPFKAVLSSRLSYSKKILKNKSAKLVMANGIQLVVPDLSVFFEIVQRSILYDQAGDYIDALADQNIRRGITLVANFLTSGHVNGDRAIHIFLGGDRTYRFPFHEVFKGTMLGQWYHFREDRTDGVNVFDARLGARQTRLLRLMLLNYLLARAQHEETVETRVDECIELFSKCGASENQIVTCLTFLSRKALVKSVTAEEIGSAATIILARSGGYYAKILSRKHVYVEECMFDTAIEDPAVWHTLSELTTAIEGQPSVVERWRLRRDRTECFLNYLSQLENESLALLGPVSHLASMSQIKESALQDATVAIAKSIRRHSD